MKNPLVPLMEFFRIPRRLRQVEEALRKLEDMPQQIRHLGRNLRSLENTLQERTELHADIAWHRKADNLIIVVGRYRNRDYVQTFSVSVDSLAEMVELLKRWEYNYGHVRTLDAPPSFKAVFEHERDKGHVKGY